jgi:hypothetical protein
MAFLSELISYCIKYVFLIAIAVSGVLLGKNLREKKSAKQEENTNE